MTEQLKPCPFCGKTPDVNDPDFCYPVGRTSIYQAVCFPAYGGCEATVYGATKEAAIKAWNTRAQAQPDAELVERKALREIIEIYAGMDGFIPETAPEGYQQRIIKQMFDIANAAISTKPDQVSDEWKQAVIDKLIACCIFSKDHEQDARKAVNDLISYEVLLALDPQVSEYADALLHKNPPGKVGVSRECAEKALVAVQGVAVTANEFEFASTAAELEQALSWQGENND